ncbi:sce7725 family protein [Burkholderia pseudomallei]|uniref:sce7725 family protein n=1 Tax=Burkholderia pseudomallei TaxID=28450 RepID=UPI000F58E7B7|nr:sce7725 family protein [Burkholderia pseudomallei]
MNQLKADGTVIPVLEPVSSNISSLRLALDAAKKAAQPAYVVINPFLGKFKDVDDATKAWMIDAVSIVKSNPFVRPTFIAGQNETLPQLRAFVKAWGGREAGVVLRGTGLPASAIASETSGKFPNTMYFLTGGTPAPSVLSALGMRNCVLVEDRFLVQPNNSLYKGIEPFTGMHLTYSKMGYGGFSDYTGLSAKFREGGSLPAAVAIHLTFFGKKTPEVFIEHFVSKSQLASDRDLAKKMREAIAAAVAASGRAGDSFGLTAAYKRYMDAHKHKTPVSLQENKRWSVAHHLDLMSGLLSGRFK